MLLGAEVTNSVHDVILWRVHSHNDYLQGQPLFDALECGSNSVEADVFLVGENLLVGHLPIFLSKDRTLEKLYLEPLRARIKQNGGWVYTPGITFWLWIEIKSEPKLTYQRLRQVLKEYQDILTRFEDGEVRTNAVTVVLTGRRPVELICAEASRLAALDCRITELGVTNPPNLFLWVSEDWNRHFKWRGNGKFAEQELEKLKSMVERSHCNGRGIRFWGVPDTPTAWQVLWDAGVDLINTDRPQEIKRWMSECLTHPPQ